jgi:murein tripeptide amidase MpaA
MRLGNLLATALSAAVTAVLVSAFLVATPTPSYAASAAPDAHFFHEKRVIGHSVRGRPITAWHRGEKGKQKVLLIATMHGNEGKPRKILASLRDGRRIRGINLWVVPVYNPDGLHAGTRKNARGVDLNRNFPFHWADLDGSYESGRRAGSEPETRAMMRFLRDIRPGRIISFHQPLHGVDTDTKNQRFSRRVARALHLPRKAFTCGGVCHGTMTGWFNSRFKGSAVTVEYGAHPTRRQMSVVAPRQLLSLFNARRVKG